MSFEGYYQRLCKNGHSMDVDCYMENDEDRCAICGAEIVWANLVDETNGSHDEEGRRIDGCVKLKIKSQKKCEHCGSILETTYKIPRNRRTQTIRRPHERI